MKQFEIRAEYNRETITVYQAYSGNIAKNAIQNQTFSAPFSFNRMTWIKPSFLWLMERSNWANKSNQEYILGIKLKRSFWEYLLSEGVLTSPENRVYKNGYEWENAFKKAKVHIQWDPERTIKGAKLPIRSIQVGISRHLIDSYVNDGIVAIEDCTPTVKKIEKLIKQGDYTKAKRLLPKENVYITSEVINKKIGAE